MHYKLKDFIVIIIHKSLHFYMNSSKNVKTVQKIGESPRVIDRGTSAHFCVSDQYLISKVLRMKEVNHENFEA